MILMVTICDYKSSILMVGCLNRIFRFVYHEKECPMSKKPEEYFEVKALHEPVYSRYSSGRAKTHEAALEIIQGMIKEERAVKPSPENARHAATLKYITTRVTIV